MNVVRNVRGDRSLWTQFHLFVEPEPCVGLFVLQATTITTVFVLRVVIRSLAIIHSRPCNPIYE